MKKKIAVAVSLLLVLALSVGGTVAWLTDSAAVTNTFTIGNVDITLSETGAETDNNGDAVSKSYKFVPGQTLAKDPTITVRAKSEKCYVFVKIEETVPLKDGVSAAFDDYFSYSVRNGWAQLKNGNDDVLNVYYKEVDASTSENDIVLYVLTGGETSDLQNGQITVNESVTKDMVENLSGNPTLKITAAAVQFDGMANAYDAWTKLPSNITGIDD